MASDYYQALGVDRGATPEQIRKAYRELARKHHPDLNPDDPGAKQRFQEVQLAFEVLNDPKKREQYDRFGSAYEAAGAGGAWRGATGWPGAEGSGGATYEFDLGDLFGGGRGAQGGGFADLFRHFGGPGQGGPGQGARRRPASRGAARGDDIEHEISVPLATAVSGGETELTVVRGGGKTESIRVKIPVGIEDGKKIRLRGQGDPAPSGGPAGDILLTVRVANHPWFRRNGDRLEVTVPVTLAEAALGAKVDVPTPRGTITLTIPPGASSGAKLRVKGHGVERAGGSTGDLVAEVQVVLPKGVTEADRRTLAEVSDRYQQEPRRDLRW